MTETLPVHVNRDGTDAIEVDPSFEATGNFAVVLHNHGRPAHVHLRLDDALAGVTRIAATNQYVESDSVKRVPVTVETDRRPVEGDLNILTGFGARSATVAIDLVEPDSSETVEVDETLGRPQDEALPEPGPAPPGVPDWVAENTSVLALAAVALFVAVVAVAVSDALSVLVGLLAVAVGVGAAVLFLQQPE